jgi:hypothetical protein
MASPSRCTRFVVPGADGDSGHMIRGSMMIDKIIGIRRLTWRVQPPKQWKKRKREAAGGFEDVLREEISMENLIDRLVEIKSDILSHYDGMDYAEAEAKAAAIDEAIFRIGAK